VIIEIFERIAKARQREIAEDPKHPEDKAASPT
jgi:hypothetical protein